MKERLAVEAKKLFHHGFATRVDSAALCLGSSLFCRRNTVLLVLLPVRLLAAPGAVVGGEAFRAFLQWFFAILLDEAAVDAVDGDVETEGGGDGSI